MFETEEIPDSDNLFYRVHKQYIRKGKLVPGVFRTKGEGEEKGMSTDWEKYSTKEESLSRCTKPENNGIVQLNAGLVRAINYLEVEHNPQNDNQSHSHVQGVPVKGKLKAKIREQLLEVFEWKILIEES